MPVLKNPKHERFAQEIAKGTDRREAYALIGLKPDAHQGVIDKLYRHCKQRIDQIMRAGATKAGTTTQRVMQMLENNYEMAVAKGDMAGANKAAELIGKQLGMFVERKEVGVPGAFDGMTLEQKQEKAVALVKMLGLERKILSEDNVKPATDANAGTAEALEGPAAGNA